MSYAVRLLGLSRRYPMNDTGIALEDVRCFPFDFIFLLISASYISFATITFEGCARAMKATRNELVVT